jgi:hypothetical protein
MYYTEQEIEQACQLLPHEFYESPRFTKNTLSAYAEALAELTLFPKIHRLASRHIAKVHGINQVRLEELYKILN